MIWKILSHDLLVERKGAGRTGRGCQTQAEHLGADAALKFLPTGTLAHEHTHRCFRKGRSYISVLLAVACLLLGCATTMLRIVANPEQATVSVSETQDITAIVSGTDNRNDKAVTWSVCDGDGNNCVSGGNSTLGTIASIGVDSRGNSMARYTAPSTEPSPPNCLSCPTGCSSTVSVFKTGGATVSNR